MKSKIKIVKHVNLSKVNYYSLKFEDESICEKEKFDNKFKDSEFKEGYQTLQYWLAVIGERRGARIDLFRKESRTNENRHKNAKALPPDSDILHSEGIENSKYVGLKSKFNSELRLYCIWMSPSVVILYNGGLKTAQDVRNCINCYPFFKNTNNVCSQLYDKQAHYELVEKKIKKASLVELEAEKVIHEE